MVNRFARFSTWTPEERQGYAGPVYRATVTWETTEGSRGHEILEAPGTGVLSGMIFEVLNSHPGALVSYGPHSPRNAVT